MYDFFIASLIRRGISHIFLLYQYQTRGCWEAAGLNGVLQHREEQFTMTYPEEKIITSLVVLRRCCGIFGCPVMRTFRTISSASGKSWSTSISYVIRLV